MLRTASTLLLLAPLALALGACSVNDEGGGGAIRETGYLSCRAGTDACGDRLECRDNTDTRSCVTPPEGCEGADQSCECLGAWLCGEQSCIQNDPSEDQTLFSCEGSDTGCGEYALGESWEADNCGNTCTCLEQGEVCSQLPCRAGCDDISAQYTATVSGGNACSTDADCQAVAGRCDVGLGGCWEMVNQDFDVSTLESLGQQWRDLSCGGGVCDCAGPPRAVCVDGACAASDFNGCGDYEIGDTWDADDGCNTCTCNADGPACTELDCEEGCGDRALGETWDADDGCNTCTCTAEGVACTDAVCELECADIQSDYDDAIAGAKSCQADNECQHLNTICALGACYEYVNMSLTQQDLQGYMQTFGDNDCIDIACDCATPAPAKCIAGECAPGPRCDPYDVGDTWTGPDGCQTCTCTFDEGVVCSDDTGCVNNRSCGDRDHQQIWPDSDNCNVCECSNGTESCTERACPPEPCRSIEVVYSELVSQASACTQDSDCTAFDGACGEGFGGCGTYVNDRLDTADLQNLLDAYMNQGCDPTDCACTATAPAACIGGTCMAASNCGVFRPGDTWVAEDGCNTCTCSPTGVPACTRRPCTAPTCESIPETFQSRVDSFQTCYQDSDCHLVNGSCGIGFGGCYHAVNTDFTAEDVRLYTDQWRSLGCSGPVCDCPAPPDSVGCVAGRCDFATSF